MRFELLTRWSGDKPGVLQQIAAPDTNRRVSEQEARMVETQAYFTRMDDGYYYWDYQKMRSTYGILNSVSIQKILKAARASVVCLPRRTHGVCPTARHRQTLTISWSFFSRCDRWS